MWCLASLGLKFHQEVYGDGSLIIVFVPDFFLPPIDLKLQCWNSAAFAKCVSHTMLSYQRMNWVPTFYTVCQGGVLT